MKKTSYRRITTKTLSEMKDNNQKISMLTAYDYTFARIIDESDINTDKVSILSKVKIKNIKLNKSFEYTIVSEEEADLQEKKLSVDSPIGKGLLGKKKGEEVKVSIPSGEVIFKIIDISL